MRSPSKTLRLTATLAALGASLGVSAESLNAAETAPKSEAGVIEAVQDKHAPTPTPIPKVVAPTPAAVQSKDGLPTPAAAQQKKESIKTPPPSRVETQSPVLTPKKIEKPLPPKEVQEGMQAPAPAVMKPEPRSPLDKN